MRLQSPRIIIQMGHVKVMKGQTNSRLRILQRVFPILLKNLKMTWNFWKKDKIPLQKKNLQKQSKTDIFKDLTQWLIFQWIQKVCPNHPPRHRTPASIGSHVDIAASAHQRSGNSAAGNSWLEAFGT